MKLKIYLFIFISISIFAQEYAVISNKILDNLSKEQIRAIYLKKLTHINDRHLVPVNLASSNDTRQKFEKELLGMGHRRLKSYWVKQHYLGKRPPVTMKSEQSAVKFVKNVQGAIAYVKIENIDENVKILYQWSDSEGK